MAKDGEFDGIAEGKDAGAAPDGAQKGCCRCCPCKHGKAHPSNPNYLVYEKRRCTNLICLIVFAMFLIGWAAVFGLAWSYGKPAVLSHAMDSHGNICGVDGSNEFQITRSDGTVETQTNSFADGTMPKDLT